MKVWLSTAWKGAIYEGRPIDANWTLLVHELELGLLQLLYEGGAAQGPHAQLSRCCLRASHTPSTTWAAPRTLMRSGFSTNHIPILRVLWGPTTQSRECSLGARNSMSPSPSVSIAKASMTLLFHTVLFSRFRDASGAG